MQDPDDVIPATIQTPQVQIETATARRTVITRRTATAKRRVTVRGRETDSEGDIGSVEEAGSAAPPAMELSVEKGSIYELMDNGH